MNSDEVKAAVELLNEAHQRTFELMERCHSELREMGVPSAYFPPGSHIFDPASDTVSLPDVETWQGWTTISWGGQDRYGDYETMSIPVDVFNGDRTPEKWAEDVYDHWVEKTDAEAKAKAARQAAMNERLSKQEYEDYLRLKAKFEK